MFIESYKRTAFERQLEEAVTIERVARENINILNSKSEWASSALPRLVTRYGKLEDEMKEYEKELKHEKSREEEFERKLREMRKIRNKARLRNERNLNPPSKRQKTEEDRFISIRTTWGAPETTAPRKNIKEPERQKDTRKRQRIEKENEKEILTNVRRVEDKVMEGETITE